MNNSLYKLKGKYNIEQVEEKPLLEALQISSNILDCEGDKKIESRNNIGDKGKEYPDLENWKGYGLKVRGMYDNGNDNWLNDISKNKEYNIAYMGINNFLGDTKQMISELKDFSSNKKQENNSEIKSSNNRDDQGNRDNKDNRDNRDNRDNKDNRDNRDNRDNNGNANKKDDNDNRDRRDISYIYNKRL